MAYQHCTVETDGHIQIITIERPDQRNALHPEANHELGEIFDAFEANPEARIAILTGAGDKAFCAGADLRSGAGPDTPFTPATGFAGLVARFDRRKPIIAAVNGFAMGGGFEAALACDIIVATEHASFGLTEPRVGLAALGGGIQRLVEELGPKRAHSLLLTGRKITATEAAAMGFVAEVVPAADLLVAARRWAEEIMLCSPASIMATKAVVRSLDGSSVERSIGEMMDLPEVRSLLTGPDAREGPRAFAERRTPNWADPSWSGLTMTIEQTVLVTREGPLATVTLNRPQRRNGVTIEMCQELFEAVRAISQSNARVLILRGAGHDFCVGADLGGSTEAMRPATLESLGPLYHAATLLYSMPQITIAAIDGGCAGAGMGWAAACDFRFGTPESRFATAFLNVGASGDMGLAWSLVRIVGAARARELLLFPEKLTGDQALQLGFITRLFPRQSLHVEVAELARQLLDRDSLAMRMLKANIVSAERLDFGEFIEIESARHLHVTARPEFGSRFNRPVRSPSE